ncbi:hydrolase [Enterococcus quebecensis]|uniref:Hydrolase n=2 Tax=Enterococcus quebecensis TaxID=903983 RepID=A0A1E5GSM0_9ENTE|nr:hydrolase [Enterococcus quebecensis]
MEINEMGTIIKRVFIIFIGMLVIIMGLFFIGNNYQMNENRVSISTTDGTLSTIITSPKQGEVKGIMVFVHGDGAQEATQDGGYKPLMERFAQQGYISVSWDKLGVGRSSGNWLLQTMDDRTKEVLEVIEWLKVKYPKYSNKIGLWGASQAGWVIPKVMSENPDIQFSIVVAPAINWIRQGEYDTENRIKDSGGTNTEILQAKQHFRNDSLLIEKNDSYSKYKNNGGTEVMTSDRYLFVRNNLNQDATDELSKVHGKTYLILAENDKNVNSLETEKIYRSKMSKKDLEVKIIPNASHQMLNRKIENSDFLINLSGLIFPKYSLINKNYLDYCEQIVSGQTS